MIEKIDDWFVQSFHDTAVSQDTAIYNAMHAATEDLKRRFAEGEAEAGPGAVNPAKTVAAWNADCVAGNSVLQRAACGELIAKAVAELPALLA